MVEITLSITLFGDGQTGIITLNRVDGATPVEMGKVRFEDGDERRWLIMVLMELHPYVSLAEESRSYDPALEGIFKGCCDH